MPKNPSFVNPSPIIPLIFISFITSYCTSPEVTQTPINSPNSPALSEQTDPITEQGPGEIVNRIRYIVGDMIITDIDIERMQKKLGALRKANPLDKTGNSAEAAIQELVHRVIVEQEAQKESILVSDARLQNEVDKRRRASGIENEGEFIQTIEKEIGLPYEQWLQEMRYQYLRQQIIQIKIPVPRPSEADVETFYKANKTKFGLEVRYREILFRAKDASLDEEIRISKLAREVANKLKSSPKSFSKIARAHKENSSPLRSRGGLQNYMPIHEVAARDRLLAGVIFNSKPGVVSQVFRNMRKNYMIVMVEGKRSVPLAKVRQMILQRLYLEQEKEAFDSWIVRRKKEVAIVTVNASQE